MDPRGDPSFLSHILDLFKDRAANDPNKYLAGDGTARALPAAASSSSAARGAFFDDFMAEAIGGVHGETAWRNFTANGGGCSAGGDPDVFFGDPKVWGVAHLTTGVQANGQSGLSKEENQIRLTAGVTEFETRVFLPDLSTAAQEYSMFIGFSRFRDPGGLGVGFKYDRLSSVKWKMVCNDGAGSTETATTVDVAADTWVKLKAVVNAAATSVEFFIDGVSVGTITTNIPDGATERLVPNMWIIKSAGTSERFLYVDYYGAALEFTVSR